MLSLKEHNNLKKYIQNLLIITLIKKYETVLFENIYILILCSYNIQIKNFIISYY